MKQKRIKELRKYIFNNWDGIKIRLTGQISHVLSARLSSRLMSWSKEGLKKMTALRVYTANKNKVVANDFKKESKTEEFIESCK